MVKENELKIRLKEINNLLKIVDPNKGCLAVDQRVKLEIEKNEKLKISDIVVEEWPEEDGRDKQHNQALRKTRERLKKRLSNPSKKIKN